MNKLTIIGNLTRDPEVRQVQTRDGAVACCDFTVAVNGRKKDSDAVYFRCTAWRGLADVIGKYAAKGKKVAVTGPVSARAYTAKDGQPSASLEVQVEDFEFLSPRGEVNDAPVDKDTGMVIVDEDVPF
jgi:single-strand DNA-binding protein